MASIRLRMAINQYVPYGRGATFSTIVDEALGRSGVEWEQVEAPWDLRIMAVDADAFEAPVDEPTPCAVVGIRGLDPDVIMCGWPDGRGVSHLVHDTESAIRYLADFIRDTSVAIVRTKRGWEMSSEVLIRKLDTLLTERDVLKQALADALVDARTAEARVKLLENQLHALQEERLQTSDEWRSPMVIASIALLIGTVLAPLGAVLVDHQLTEPVQEVVEQTVVVRTDCDLAIASSDVDGPLRRRGPG